MLIGLLIGISLIAWLDVGIFYIITKQLKKKLSKIQTFEQMGQYLFKETFGKSELRILQLHKLKYLNGMKVAQTIQKYVSIIFIVISLWTIFSLMSKVILFVLFHEKIMADRRLMQLISNEIIMLTWFGILGGYIFIKQVCLYFSLLLHKFEEVGIIEQEQG